MQLKDVADLLGATVFYAEEGALEREVSTAAASDLMSDILTRIDAADILVTGLNNPQVIHTASVSGIKAVVIARGKIPSPQLIERAQEENIVLLSTGMTLFEASGLLFSQGLRSAGIPR